ncbi:MAG: hypothetical protein Q9181_000404 [Wetmoreana brouardii]
MPTLKQELLIECAEGNTVKVREAVSTIRRSGVEGPPFEAMALKTAENDYAGLLELCIDEGADYDFTKWLLEHGADPNSGHLMGDSNSAITAAAERGRTDFSERLVKHGAKVSGSGALAGAAEKQHTEMVGWLLDRGADVDEIGLRDYGDRRKKKCEGTALHKAAANGDIETGRLIDHGARLDIKDPMERTPLMLALEENHEEVARFLKSVGSTS